MVPPSLRFATMDSMYHLAYNSCQAETSNMSVAIADACFLISQMTSEGGIAARLLLSFPNDMLRALVGSLLLSFPRGRELGFPLPRLWPSRQQFLCCFSQTGLSLWLFLTHAFFVTFPETYFPVQIRYKVKWFPEPNQDGKRGEKCFPNKIPRDRATVGLIVIA